MKKWLIALLVVLCLVSCCTLAAAADGEESSKETEVSTGEEFPAALEDGETDVIELTVDGEGTSKETEVSTEEDFLAALEDGETDVIKVTADITLAQNVTIARSVQINLVNGDGDGYAISGEGVTLTINEGVELFIGDLSLGASTYASGSGRVYVDVVNNGELKGSTSFYGKVTNNGMIYTQHFFYGELCGDGINSSTVDLILDANGYAWDGSYDGWTSVDSGRIQKEVIRGQVLGNGLPEIRRSGWTFQGWYSGETEATADMRIKEKTTLKANWEFDSASGYTLHTLTFEPNGAEGTKEPLYFVAGDKLVMPDSEPLYGEDYTVSFIFLGWNTQADRMGKAYAPGDVVTAGDSDVTLYAQWVLDPEATPYAEIYYHKNDETESDTTYHDDSAGSSMPVPVKSWSDFDWEEPDGKAFEGWSYYADGMGTLLQPGDKVNFQTGGVNLYAKWKAKVYTVTFVNEFGGETSVSVEHGKTVTKPADPEKTGYTFQGWYSGDEPFDFATIITGDVTLTAKWKAKVYTVTFVNEFDGETSVSVEHGKTVTKPADPEKTGYTFQGWYSGDELYDFDAPVTGDVVLTARWKMIEVDTAPKTGDDAPLGLWFTVLAVGLCGLGWLRRRDAV